MQRIVKKASVTNYFFLEEQQLEEQRLRVEGTEQRLDYFRSVLSFFDFVCAQFF